MLLYLCLIFFGLATASPFKQLTIPLDNEDKKSLEIVRSELERNNLGDDTIISATINAYADKIIANIDSFMKYQKFDPMNMPDISKSFRKFLISGEFTLTEGVMTHASSLHRQGDCIVTYNKTSKYMKVTTPLAFDSLDIEYHYKAKYMHVGPSGRTTGGVTNFRMVTVIGVDYNTYLANLDKYEITNSGHISVKFHGHFFYDWMMDTMSYMTTAALKPIILELVQVIVAKTMKSGIQKINVVLQKILNSEDPIELIASVLPNQFIN